MASARDLGLERGYRSWPEMLERELTLSEAERIEAVGVVTPNDLHYPVAKAFAEAGFHIICDKPLVHNCGQADDLLRVVEERAVVFGVTYNYTGYPMVKEARRLVQEGAIGRVRKVIAEYHLDWALGGLRYGDFLERAGWRIDPVRCGPGGAIADLGSHAENLAHYVTGLELDEVCADFETYVPAGTLDDDANVLLRFRGGANGVLVVSRASVGAVNDLRIRVFGGSGTLVWRFSVADRLLHLTMDGAAQELTHGEGGPRSATNGVEPVRIDLWEGAEEAFADIYDGVAVAIRGERGADFPTLRDGARGVAFIEACVESVTRGGVWTPVRSWS